MPDQRKLIDSSGNLSEPHCEDPDTHQDLIVVSVRVVFVEIVQTK